MKVTLCFDLEKLQPKQAEQFKEYVSREAPQRERERFHAFVRFMYHTLKAGGAGLDAMGFCGAEVAGVSCALPDLPCPECAEIERAENEKKSSGSERPTPPAPESDSFKFA